MRRYYSEIMMIVLENERIERDSLKNFINDPIILKFPKQSGFNFSFKF